MAKVRYTLKISMGTTTEYRLLECESDWLPVDSYSCIEVAEGWTAANSFKVWINPATNHAVVQIEKSMAGDRDAYERLYRDCLRCGWRDYQPKSEAENE